MRSRLGEQYRRRVHPALRARIRRWRTPAPPRQEQLVTVVVTKLDARPDQVHSCLESVVRTSYRNTEILVLIDGASRSAAAVVRSYARWDARIRLLERPGQSTPGSGSQSPNGHYLMVVEASQRLETRAVATLVKALRLTESDFAVGLVDHRSDEALLVSPDSRPPQGMDRLGLTMMTCPDHFTADGMAGTLFRYRFLGDLGWTVAAAPTIDQREFMDRAYRWGRFDLVSQRVFWPEPEEPQPMPSPRATVTTTSAHS